MSAIRMLQKFPEIPAILEIQGILASVSEEFYGGLTPMELLKCWNIKEFLKPKEIINSALAVLVCVLSVISVGLKASPAVTCVLD